MPRIEAFGFLAKTMAKILGSDKLAEIGKRSPGTSASANPRRRGRAARVHERASQRRNRRPR